MSEFFPYHFDKRFMPMWLGAGALPWRDGVTITDANASSQPSAS